MAQAPVRQTRAEKKAETRERLLVAAEKIAREQGFARITLDAVATAAGLTKGAIYSNFESKEDLMLEVLARLTPGLNMNAEIEDAPDLDTLLRRLGPLIGGAARTRAKQVALALEFDALAMRDPALRRAMKAADARLRAEHPEDDAAGWLRDRGMDPPVPAEQFFLVMNALAVGLISRRIIQGEAEVPDELITWAFTRLASSD
ncbi:MAG: TetR/AcrR family transcriptional regulator [Actinobacteria bacterium]|nr:TetR/AcrR family transcriptional regulator [Actinomycetota bacterium]MBV8961242.1 TetR/AcrR family transcriptional regulator [Actinomycetota bacterium]MBV9255682.1 TetR/AcrR family transcriptional regulator [Actinomycetota bacterium]MBV9665092.1 TetR/AcrR family transcriptional regulator [Actinomycetota bacterium]MBV9935072.1 TetR/AcrR family transcriptional regulator [Actinomycetota bacterium]